MSLMINNRTPIAGAPTGAPVVSDIGAIEPNVFVYDDAAGVKPGKPAGATGRA
jgi:hypothetical protein